VSKVASAYHDVLAWLYALESARGMDFKLERTALALRSMGDPHLKYATVHVAGTNGKGSVAAMLHAICGSGGLRVGLYTSPHLVSFTERIRVGATMITPAEVVGLTNEIRTAVTIRGIDLTFFEFVTVMAFLHFARCGVDLAIVEVGLGGRLDATNVVDPDVTVITTIGRDHEEFLGETLASVAWEKAGIIKPDRPVIIGRIPEEAAAVVEQVASARSAPTYWMGRDFSVDAAERFRFSGLGWELDDLALPMRGTHQRENAATALAAAACLRGRWPFDDGRVRAALAGVRWPGRLDVVQAHPLVVLDGAHNADGAVTLMRELAGVVGTRRVHLLFAVMRDKRWQPMIDALGPYVASVTLTAVLPPRGETPEVLANAFQRYCPVRVVADPLEGLEVLLQSVGPDAAVLVAGSLFLIGAVYPYFLSRRGEHQLFSPTDAALPS
jgi:dihydrofolate synthase / folylpolyglutamate synthase